MTTSIETRGFTMSELVARTGVSAPTVRYYLSEKLLPLPLRLAANRFLYDERHVEVIRLIRLLRERRGLSIDSIRSMLPQLLPDLLGHPEGALFRPEMWHQLLEVHTRPEVGPSVAERVTRAALAAFGHRGYADVAIEDVCRAAGIAKGSFYRHFPSKEELFFAVAGIAASEVAERVGELAPQDVETAVTIMAETLGEYLAILLDLASLAAQRRPGYPRALRALLTSLADSLGPLLGAGAFRSGQVSSEEVVARALARALARATDELAIAPLNEIQLNDVGG